LRPKKPDEHLIAMGTHYKGTKREVQALNTFIKLMRGTGSLTSRLRSHLDNSSLTEKSILSARGPAAFRPALS